MIRRTAIGAGIGMIFGAAFGAPAPGLVIGAALGLVGAFDSGNRPPGSTTSGNDDLRGN